MGKLATLFYVFVFFVLVLFSCFTFLMTTVNPAPLVTHTTVAAAKATTATTTATAMTDVSSAPMKPLMKLRGYESEGPWTREQSKKDEYRVLINEIVSKPFNDTDPKKTKGRRSIQNRKKNPGVVVMKVVDGDGKPRIEIVFYPKRATNDWKMYRKNNILGSKHKTNSLRNPILNIMPDDSIVFENYWGLDRIPEAISDKTEVTKKVYDVKSHDSSISKTLNHSVSVTNLNTYLLSSPYPENNNSIENPHANITTEMEKDYSDELQKKTNKEEPVESKNNLLHSTNLSFDIVSLNKGDIGVSQYENTTYIFDMKDLGIVLTPSNLTEGTTESNSILMLSAPETSSIEGPHVNDPMKTEMGFSEEILNDNERLTELSPDSHPSTQDTPSEGVDKNTTTLMPINNFSEKEQNLQQSDNVMNINTDTLLNTTILNITVDSSIEPDIWITETSTTNASHNEARLLSAQDMTSSDADETYSTQMTINNINNEKEQTSSSDNDRFINRDTILNSTKLNTNVDSSNEPDIWISDTPTTNASHNEATLLSTQDTLSSDTNDGYSTQMTIDINNEKVQTSLDNDRSIKKYIYTLLNSTILNITVDSSNEPDILLSDTPTTNASHNEATILSIQDTSSAAPDENISRYTHDDLYNISEK